MINMFKHKQVNWGIINGVVPFRLLYANIIISNNNIFNLFE